MVPGGFIFGNISLPLYVVVVNPVRNSGIYIDSQQEQSLETREDKYVVLLNGGTKI